VVPVIPNETDFVTAAIAETIIVGSSLCRHSAANFQTEPIERDK